MPEVIDLTEEHKDLYLCCLDDWHEGMTSVRDYKRCWMEAMKPAGLRCKIAIDDSGTVGGMIEYMPIEVAPAEGSGLYFINCIWVHGHKKGRGNMQKRGMGRALLAAAEEDARDLGAKGMAAWGLWLPFWMRASFFKRHGYRKADREGVCTLVWKAFEKDAQPPRWIRSTFSPELVPGKVVVTAFINGQCPVANLTFDLFKTVAAEFGDKVLFREISTQKKEDFLRYGEKDAIFIDGKKLSSGPPISEEKVRKKLAKAVARLPRT